MPSSVLLLANAGDADPEIPRQIPINNKVSLGRIVHPDWSDVRLHSNKFAAMISRKHATIEFKGGKWCITDHKSTNGILINKQPIAPDTAHPITDKDEVTFGTAESDLIFSFSLDVKPSANPWEGNVSDMVLGRGQAMQIKQLEAARNVGLLTEEQFIKKRDALWQSNEEKFIIDVRKVPNSTKEIPGLKENDLVKLRVEKAFKYVYNFSKRQWEKSMTVVSMEQKPFEQGALRVVYRMTDYTQPPGEQNWVAKLAKDPKEGQQIYFADAEMQAFCSALADEFSKRDPPKEVRFAPVVLIEMHERANKPLFSCEPFLSGKYVKHNNNWGFVSPEDRNTPQAFSHFTHVITGQKYLVCDIQGVSDAKGDCFTDPQIHSRDQKGFGKGNMGKDGIDRFFATHKCNYICEHLGIAISKNMKQRDRGTAPPRRPTTMYSITDAEKEKLGLNEVQYRHLVTTFQKFDSDKLAAIPREKFLELCHDLGVDLEPNHLANFTNNLDKEGSGRITFRKFVHWWSGGQEEDC